MIRLASVRMITLAAGAAALSLGAMTPLAASAQGARYDGYCYVKKSDLAGKDAAIGAAAGAIAGGLLGKKGDKTKSAVIGGAVGGAAGYVVGKNSHEKIRCRGADYFVFKNGYYEPAPRADHKVVYFESRPAGMNYWYISKGKTYRYR
jgi:outer membrane lipoprotein SlyB